MHFPVAIDIKPSRRLRAALLFVHLISLAAIGILAFTWPFAVAGFPVVLWSGVRLLKASGDCRFTLESDGTLRVDGASARILAGTTVFVWLVVMRYRLEGQGGDRSCVVLADSLSAEDFRRLRVWLRWAARA